MPSIKLSKRAFEAARTFFESHPVFTIEQVGEISVEGPGGEMVEVINATCDKCGFTWRPFGNPMLGEDNLNPKGQRHWPASTIPNIVMTHAWDKSTRATYCGGRMIFNIVPVNSTNPISSTGT